MTNGMSGQNQRFPETILGLLLVLPVMFGGRWLVERLQESACPWDTFLTGSLYPAAQLFLGIAVLMTWYFAARHVLLHQSSTLQKWLKADLSCDHRWHERWGLIAAITFSATLIGFLTVVRAQYCLTLYAIKNRPLLSNTLVTHDWRSVSEINVECHRGSKGRTDWRYDLLTRDGFSVDISHSNEGIDWAYFYLHQVLAGVKFRFDTSQIQPNCPMDSNHPARFHP